MNIKARWIPTLMRTISNEENLKIFLEELIPFVEFAEEIKDFYKAGLDVYWDKKFPIKKLEKQRVALMNFCEKDDTEIDLFMDKVLKEYIIENLIQDLKYLKSAYRLLTPIRIEEELKKNIFRVYDLMRLYEDEENSLQLVELKIVESALVFLAKNPEYDYPRVSLAKSIRLLKNLKKKKKEL